MKKSRETGITLITLTIAVCILIVISSLLVYNAKNGIKMRNLKMMYNDIELLSDKVEAYNAKYGALPAEIEYWGIRYFSPEPNDNDKYYVIDLHALDGISLNYGSDFENITSEQDTLNYDNLYIINEQSHHIYYARGIEMDGVLYYTADSDDEITLQDKVDKPEESDEPDEEPDDKPVDKPETGGATFSRQWGVIEIEFLDSTSYDTTTTPNEPNMTDDMKAVYWENGVEKVEGESADFDKSKWYNYIAQTGATTSGGTSKWANAKTSDGSYWVWIPRYAYRIVYFDKITHRDAYRADNTQTEGIIGYSDARGLVDKDGKTPKYMGEPVTSIGVGENKLRPHPASEDGTSTGFTQGEWDSKLEGIWVAKYEVCQRGTTIKSIPGVQSYRNIEIGDAYTKGYNYDREKESHMMKNSEWGAVAYLTDSKYGRNGTAVSLNSNNGYYTGGTIGATALTNPLQSTTGNEYGIYDTVGGADEYVTGYVADSSHGNGNSFASTDNTTNNKTDSTKYATVYKMSSSNDNRDNYFENENRVFGDGTIETSTNGTGTQAWYASSSSSFFIGVSGANFPFFERSGGIQRTYRSRFFLFQLHPWGWPRQLQFSCVFSSKVM